MNENRHYRLVSQTIRWMAAHRSEQPELDTLAAAMDVSPYHLQRTFQAWAGVSPKQFLKSLTRQSARERLMAGAPVLDAALDTGLSSPGRLHDLMITTEALTPGEIRRKGMGVSLEFGFGESPFGQALLAWSGRGLNFLGFSEEVGAGTTLASLQSQWENAEFRENPAAAKSWIDRIFAGSADQSLPIWLRGSPFQLKVWEALLRIPEGTHCTYGWLAEAIGKQSAARAVGGAIGRNPIAWIIPCHRVIRQVGELGGYRWGGLTKSAMIGFEAAQLSRSKPPSTLLQVSE
jgi:AraC family transcriptional regulator of adaptative response/methylated-DNA-[protein]-cysteine methyltransferase